LIVDCHCHVIAPEVNTAVTAAVPDSVVGEFADVDVMLARATARGIDHLLLSPWIKLIPVEAETGAALKLCYALNEALAAMKVQHPGRVSVLGAVPLQDPAAAAAHLRELVPLGFSGAEVPASVAGRYLGDDAFEPFWAAAEATGALIFVHPTTTGFSLDALRSYYLWNSVGNPMETAITAAHMITAGVLERHPGLKVLLAHGGGGLHAVRGRLRRAFAVRPEARSRSTEGPDLVLRRFWYDSLTHDAGLLTDLVGFVGADHVVLGTDSPFDMGADQPVGDIGALGRNGARLLGLDTA
jgi:aminocarboxymuconate-semialdehyde decarboxylase